MAGPTTVSALIHAATMVKAGVYLVARSYPLFVQNAEVMLLVAVIGGLTAFIAASMALNNMNIKRVLAYSTISQLGYMIMALGAGGYIIATEMGSGNIEGSMGYSAGVFHMMNHAFFKALLFMCAGSVIHAVATEDMRKMGGLSTKMKITSTTMLIGCMSIAGFPLLSGFWSKDLILEAMMGPSGAVFTLLFTLAMVTAFMTAFYMFRLWFMTFKGKPGEATETCHGESPKSMTVPLIILSAFAALSGYLMFIGLSGMISFSWINGAFVIGGEYGYQGMGLLEKILTSVWTYVSIAVAMLGIALAYLMYVTKDINPSRFGDGMLSRLLTARYHFPRLYDEIALKGGLEVAKGVDYLDKNMIDGTVNGITNAVVGSSESVRKIHTGHVKDYAALMAIGVVALFVIMFLISGGI
jgi:NADH-quinone oxidoreductase subunit L